MKKTDKNITITFNDIIAIEIKLQNKKVIIMNRENFLFLKHNINVNLYSDFIKIK